MDPLWIGVLPIPYGHHRQIRAGPTAWRQAQLRKWPGRKFKSMSPRNVLRAVTYALFLSSFGLAGAACTGGIEAPSVEDDGAFDDGDDDEGTDSPQGGQGGEQGGDEGGTADAGAQPPPPRKDGAAAPDGAVGKDASPPRDAGPRVPPPPRPNARNVYSPEGELPSLPAPNTASLPGLVAGYGARRVTSGDGETWQNDVAAIAKGYDDWDNLRASTGAGGYLVAVGGGPRHDIVDGRDDFGRGYWRVLVSADGVEWVDMRGPGNWFGGIAYGHGLWVAAGGNGWWGHSKDLVHWVENPQHPTNNSAYRDLAFGNGIFIAVGGGNRMVSRDGLTWSQRTAGSSQAIEHGDGVFVAVGSNGCATTSDGISWRENVCGGEARDVTYGNGVWVATSRDRLATSRDAVTWTAHASQNIVRIGFAQGVFVGAMPGGIVKTSTDGQTWKVAYRRSTSNDWNTAATVTSAR